MSLFTVDGGGFPTQVNVLQAIGVEGDFSNPGDPIQTAFAPGGSFVAGINGVSVGAFVWQDPVSSQYLNNYGTGLPLGLVHRAQQGLITKFLGYATLVVPLGLPVTVMQQASLYLRNNGTVAATPGMKVYARNADGLATFNVTGTPPAGASCTGGTLAKIVSASTGGALPTTNTCTASIAGNVLTVTAVGSGSVLGAGQTITGTGIDSSATVSITAQLTGTAGSTGTYQISQTYSEGVGSTTITMSGGGLTLTGANTTGVFAIGMVISGTNIPTGTTITGYGTGSAGGAGTYTVDRVAASAATASTITATNAMFLTVDSSSTGTWLLNDLLTGASVSAGTSISATAVQNANLTGTGGAGTYLTTTYQTAIGSQTFGTSIGIETNWVATSSGAAGELVAVKNQYNV